MSVAGKKSPNRYALRRYVYALMFVWTGLNIGSAWWNFSQIIRHELGEAYSTAKTIYKTEILQRRWNSEFGGVYVPVTEANLPNPYLTGIPDRDITTLDGKKLTLINPAYMMRQMHEIMDREEHNGLHGHLTSLNPLRPGNKADEWEAKALTILESGEAKEVKEMEKTVDGKERMRIMFPLYTDASCLKCHAHQGYTIGDVRGGLGISVIVKRSMNNIRVAVAAGHFALWFLGMTALVTGSRRLIRAEGDLEKYQKHLEDLVLERTSELTRTNRLLESKNSELEHFAHTVSHDLKAPLVNIEGFLWYLEEDCKKHNSEKAKADAERIKTSVRKMADMIDKVLKLSRAGQVVDKPVKVSMQEVVNDVLSFMEAHIYKNNISVNVTGDLPEVTGDPARLSAVIQNLVENSVKYMGDQNKPEIEIGNTVKCGETVFYIKDNGMGIEDADKTRIFELFSQVSEASGGVGAGLAIVKKIIEVHGGKIWAESEGKGKGSTFWFTLGNGR